MEAVEVAELPVGVADAVGSMEAAVGVHPEEDMAVEAVGAAGVVEEMSMVQNTQITLRFLPINAVWLLARAERPSKQLILPLVLTAKSTKVLHRTQGMFVVNQSFFYRVFQLALTHFEDL